MTSNFLSILVSLVSRKGLEYRARPLKDVIPSGSSGFDWEVPGERASFLLEPRGRCLGRGWYMAEILVRMDRDRGVVRIGFETQQGPDEPGGIDVPVHSGKICKRLFFLDVAPGRVVFLPGGPGLVSLMSIRFKWVGARFAESRMLRRLAAKDPILLGREPGEIRKRIAEEGGAGPYMNRLMQRYGETFPSDSSAARYALWIRRFEEPEWENPDQVRVRVEKVASGPLFSVLLPVYETDERWLRRSIESVLGQHYPHWELCICDDASPSPHVAAILQEYAARDGRIRLVSRDSNGHISRATNTAFALSSGEYVAFLDHDDELAPQALLCVAEEIEAHPEARIIYSDEDFLDEHGERKNPHFKPDYNPDLLLSHNYITHLCVVTRDLFRETGGMRVGFEGSQDYDFLLRCLSRVPPSGIRHIASVLYHWRAVPGSTAHSSGAKEYSVEAGRKALTEHLERAAISGEVVPGRIANTYRIFYPVHSHPRVSIIVPTKDRVDLVSRCIESVLEKTEYAPYEILIVDNSSTEPRTHAFLKKIGDRKRVRILNYPFPFNYSAINNFAVEQAAGDLVCLLNNDTEVISGDWLREMVSHALRPGVGCVGAKLLYGNRQIQHGGIVLGLGGYAAHSHRLLSGGSNGYFGRLTLVQNYCAVTGACLLVDKKKYFEVNGLDEEAFAVGYNDVDFCLKLLSRGYRNVWTPFAELYHFESMTRGTDDSGVKKARFDREKRNLYAKWKTYIRHDPCYNANLTSSAENFAVRT